MKPTTNDRAARERAWLLKEKYGGAASGAFQADLARLEAGEPVDYVIGFSQFLGCRVDLSRRPLIPRPETEYWAGEAIAEIAARYDAPLRILDIFAGSGCIGIAALSRLPNAQADFAEIDPAFVEQIKINLDLNGIASERYRIFESDIWSGIPAGTKYDVIFANPPYIGDHSRPDASVLGHEPHVALFAGEGGLSLIRRTIECAGEFLSPGGRLYIEHDHDQKAAIEAILKTRTFASYSFYPDQFGLLRWVSIVV